MRDKLADMIAADPIVLEDVVSDPVESPPKPRLAAVDAEANKPLADRLAVVNAFPTLLSNAVVATFRLLPRPLTRAASGAVFDFHVSNQ